MAGEWLTATVESLSRIVCSGGTPRTGVADYYDGGSIPWVTTTEVDYNRIVQTDKCITEAGLAASSAKMVPPGTVIVAMYGRGTAGRVAMAGVPLTTNQACCNLVVDETQADARFVYYSLWSNFSKLDALANGSVQQNLSAGVIRAFEILVPPLSEQRAIAHILGTLDDKIELNRRMARTLEDMARALFKAWFVDFEPVRAKMDGRWRPGESLPGLPAHLYDLFPDRLVDSELGEIPEGWEVGRLGDVAEHPRRGVRPSDMVAETPYIGLEHMPRRSIALSDWGSAGAVASNKFEFKRGEILFGKLRPYFHKVGVAPVDGVCSTDIVVLKPRDAGWFAYLLCHVSHAAFVEFTSAGSTGTRMPRTSWSQMARYPLVLPPGSVAAAFLVQVQSAVDQILAGIHESRTLAGLRDALLPRLVSGEVRVTDPDRILVEAGRSDV